MRKLVLILALVAACKGKKVPKPAEVTHAECVQVGEHLGDLVAASVVAHADDVWNSLQGQDLAKSPDLDPGLTRETFRAWLATDRGKAWIVKSRERTSAKFDDRVAMCVARASKDNIKCWLGAKSVAAFGQCPDPTSR